MGAIRKTETINLRVDAATRELIARAAEVSGKSVTAFMTEAAYAAAQAELLDQRFVHVDATVFDAVEDILSGPTERNDRLAALMRSERRWMD